MARAVLVTLGFLLAVPAARAELRVENVQIAFSPCWSERKAEFYPTDTGVFRFLLHGVKTNGEGKVRTQMSLEVKDGNGQQVQLTTHPPEELWIGEGKNSCFNWAQLGLAGQLEPGNYVVTVTVKDLLSGEQVSFQRPITIKPAELRILTAGFFADAEHKLLISNRIPVGMGVHFAGLVHGYDQSQGKIDVSMRFKVVGSDGKELHFPEKTSQAKSDIPADKKADSFTAHGNFPIFAPGDYNLQIDVRDNMTGQKTGLTIPFTAVLP